MSSSVHCANSFFEIGNNKLIEPVYYGVALNDAVSKNDREVFRNKYKIKKDNVLIFFMGRMLRDMGLDVVLETTESLLNAEPNARILIAGAEGELTSQALKIANLYSDKVFVVKNVSFSQKREFYSVADILVAPTFNQRACMGVSIKEGMAAGLPIVAGAGGGIPEAVIDGETGFLIPTKPSGTIDGDLYLTSIIKLIKDHQLRSKLGNAGRQRAEELFSVETTNFRIAEILSAVMRPY